MSRFKEIKTRLALSLPELKKRYPIKNLALFGSVTRSDFDEHKSDVDILVEFDGEIGWDFFDLEQEIQTIIGYKVDLVAKRAIKPHYWESIEKDVIHV